VVSNVHGVIKECDTIDTCLYVDFIRCVTCRQKVFGIAVNHVYGKNTLLRLYIVIHVASSPSGPSRSVYWAYSSNGGDCPL
jgi:hypothetical protein